MLLKASARVVMSTTPTVRIPNSAGNAPVTSDKLPIKPVSKKLPKPVTPSGNMTPLMRNCHVGVVVANMKRPAGRRVLRHARCLKQNFFDSGVAALRQSLDLLACDRVRCRSYGRIEIAAVLIESVTLGLKLLSWRLGGRNRPRCCGSRCWTRFWLRFLFFPDHADFRKSDGWRSILRECEVVAADKSDQCKSTHQNSAAKSIDLSRHDTTILNAGGNVKTASRRSCCRGMSTKVLSLGTNETRVHAWKFRQGSTGARRIKFSNDRFFRRRVEREIGRGRGLVRSQM